MATKTPGVRISLDSALAGTKVGQSHGQSTRGLETAARPHHAGWDAPPGRTTHVGQSATKQETFHAGHGDTLGGLNSVDSRDKSTMDLDRDRPTLDSPVPTKHRQLPDKNITSKAQEVASELHKHSEGEGFPAGGAMSERR